MPPDAPHNLGTTTMRDIGARLCADPAAGVWFVANPDWIDGPGHEAAPYADELSALRAANDAGYWMRAWFVPFGSTLRDVMNATPAASPHVISHRDNRCTVQVCYCGAANKENHDA